MTDFAKLREAMVERQLAARGIRDPAVLEAMRRVPRECFVPVHLAHRAYDDCALPIDAGQTISQPYIVALTIEAAGVKSGDKVLEVGAGSGYAAAVIGQIAGEVTAIELVPALACAAQGRLQRLGYANVRIVEGDGTLGFAEKAPFDAILAAASGSHVPPALVDQLKPGGALVMPLGTSLRGQSLVRIVKRDDGTTVHDALCPVRFVPMVGAS